MMVEKLRARPVLMHWPDGEGEGYTGQVEVLSGDFLTWRVENPTGANPPERSRKKRRS